MKGSLFLILRMRLGCVLNVLGTSELSLRCLQEHGCAMPINSTTYKFKPLEFSDKKYAGRRKILSPRRE